MPCLVTPGPNLAWFPVAVLIVVAGRFVRLRLSDHLAVGGLAAAAVVAGAVLLGRPGLLVGQADVPRRLRLWGLSWVRLRSTAPHAPHRTSPYSPRCTSTRCAGPRRTAPCGAAPCGAAPDRAASNRVGSAAPRRAALRFALLHNVLRHCTSPSDRAPWWVSWSSMPRRRTATRWSIGPGPLPSRSAPCSRRSACRRVSSNPILMPFRPDPVSRTAQAARDTRGRVSSMMKNGARSTRRWMLDPETFRGQGRGTTSTVSLGPRC